MRRLGPVGDEVVDGEAFEELDGAAANGAVGEVRALPERRSAAGLDAWRGEVKAVAVAAAGGLAAGAATVAAVNAIKSRAAARRQPARILRRNREEGILASRSFLIDVHLLDR